MAFVPISTDYTVVIAYSGSQKKFDRTLYAPVMTGGRATSEEVSQVLSGLENVLPKSPSAWCTVAWIFFFIATALFFYLQMWWNGYMMQNYSVFAVCTLILLCVLASKSNKAKNKEARAQADAFLQGVQPSFQARGLRWHLPNVFPYYVELLKDYREQGTTQNISPVQQALPQINNTLQPSYPYLPPPLTNQYNGDNLAQPLIYNQQVPNGAYGGFQQV